MSTLITKLHRLLTEKELSGEEASAEVIEAAPRNFVVLLLARMGSKVGDRLANPKTTLAWLLQALDASSLTLGLLVPLRESGSLLPQVFLSGYLKRMSARSCKELPSLGLG